MLLWTFLLLRIINLLQNWNRFWWSSLGLVFLSSTMSCNRITPPVQLVHLSLVPSAMSELLASCLLNCRRGTTRPFDFFTLTWLQPRAFVTIVFLLQLKTFSELCVAYSQRWIWSHKSIYHEVFQQIKSRTFIDQMWYVF